MGAVSKKKVGECPLDSAVVRGRSETRRARRVCVEGRKVAAISRQLRVFVYYIFFILRTEHSLFIDQAELSF